MKDFKIYNDIALLLEKANTIRINNLSESILLSEKSLSLSLENNFNDLIAKSYCQLGLYNMVVGEMEKAAIYSREAIKIYTKLKDEKGIADSKYSLAGVYYKTNLYHLGLIEFIDALIIYQKLDDYYNQSRTEKSLGTIYGYIGDQSKALRSYNQAVKNAAKINDLNLESNVYNNISGILANNGKLKFAMRFINKSIELKTQTNDIRGLAYAFYGKGKVYFQLNEYNEASKYYFKALKIHKEMGENTGLAMTYTKLGELYFKLKNLDLALENALTGLELANNLKLAMSSIKLNKLIYLIYKSKNDNKKALDYFEFYQLEKESVINIQTLKVIESYELISKMEVIKKESKLQAEKQLILDKKNEDEINALKLRQDFLSVMSHEIRTPLNAITSIVELLNDKVKKEDFELVNTLQFASLNLINIVNDVLDFTKLDLNKAQLELSFVDLFELTNNIKNVYENQASNKGLMIKLNCDVNNDSLYYIDELKITQVLTNLLSNAIKFSNQGTIEINIYISHKGLKKDTIYFGVSDNGEGISKTNKSEIFTSFLQIKPILTRNEGGTGLGLAIVKKIIELHGGKIKVKSKLGKGSTFYFKIKASSIKKEKVKKETKTDSNLLDQKLNRLKVLIVEDTVINAILLRKILSKWNVTSEHVERGKLAIEKVKTNKYDIILMDIHMPEMNGFEAAYKIKNTENLNNNTPIIAVTADTLLESKTYNLDCFRGVVLKPFKIENLKNSLLSVI
jgi:signal transduction histidine kinase